MPWNDTTRRKYNHKTDQYPSDITGSTSMCVKGSGSSPSLKHAASLSCRTDLPDMAVSLH